MSRRGPTATSPISSPRSRTGERASLRASEPASRSFARWFDCDHRLVGRVAHLGGEPVSAESEDPDALAREMAALARPMLVGLDVDGVLAPIVAHADNAELLPGMREAVTALAHRVAVAVVSGRTV